MELFIRIKNGQTFEHPIFGDNFRQAFPNVDPDNLPPEFAKFVRVQAPALGVYEKNQISSYQLIDGVYTDVFTVEQMTAEEIAQKQQATKDSWAENNGFASWSFDDTTCTFVPPVPRPTDGNNYAWRESDTSWVYVPEKPQGDGWEFNLNTGVWEKK